MVEAANEFKVEEVAEGRKSESKEEEPDDSVGYREKKRSAIEMINAARDMKVE